MKYQDRLQEAIIGKQNRLCLGIDPFEHSWPKVFDDLAKKEGPLVCIKSWAELLIEELHKKIPAIKFQSAFFEAHGWRGMKVLTELVSLSKTRGLVTILDAKRGDISTSMYGYGRFAFDELQADALTVNPYMGLDVIDPIRNWLTMQGKGIYVLWLTSNPSADVLQEAEMKSGKFFYQEFLNYLAINLDQSCPGGWGLVTGATKLDLLTENEVDDLWQRPLLLPGMGAQKAVLPDILLPKLSNKQEALNPWLFPLSRGLTGVGSKDERWQQCLTKQDYLKEVGDLVTFYQKLL